MSKKVFTPFIRDTYLIYFSPVCHSLALLLSSTTISLLNHRFSWIRENFIDLQQCYDKIYEANVTYRVLQTRNVCSSFLSLDS